MSNPTNDRIAISGASSFSSDSAISPTPTHVMSAARADRNPGEESPNTMHFYGDAPSSSAALRYGSGYGFKFSTSSMVIEVEKPCRIR